MNAKELSVMRHALGLDEDGRGRQYRNHFCTGPGSDDWDTCNGLVERELMSRRAPSALFGGDYMFHVTEEGRQEVAKATPPPPPPVRVSRGRQRYLRWLNEASDAMTFGQWLKEGYG